jgi:hypothetical protein
VVKGNELVWRTVIDAALLGNREWANIDDLAHAAGTPVSTAHLALRKLTSIGAVEPKPRGGVVAVNPEKALLVLAAWRNLGKDTLARTSLVAVQALLDTHQGAYALGGADAARTHLQDRGHIASISAPGTRIVYITPEHDVATLPPGDEVIVLAMDSRAALQWHTGYTSAAQTYADLFALPGWQAEEYRRALHHAYFGAGVDR